VSWTAPSDDGGSQITGYTVTPVTGGAAGTPSEDEQRREDAIAFRTAGLKGAVVGAVGLASTSRLMPALWTVALLFAAVLLLLVGRTPHCPKPLPSGFVNPSGVGGSCPARDLAGTSRFADQLGKNYPQDIGMKAGLSQVIRRLEKPYLTSSASYPAARRHGEPA
jgi:hypothetical protein